MPHNITVPDPNAAGATPVRAFWICGIGNIPLQE